MKEVFTFLAENSWLRNVLVVAFLFVVAWRPTLRYFQFWIKNKAAKAELSTYEILRKEINLVNVLLQEKGKENRLLSAENEELNRQLSAASAAQIKPKE